MIVKTFHPSYPLYDSWKVTPPCEYPEEKAYCHYLCPFAEECGIEDPFAEDDDEDDDDYDGEEEFYNY